MENIITITNLKLYKNQKIKVGIVGGSFDPPHHGHIHIAVNAMSELGLDEIWFAVAYQNPLKPPHKYLYEERVAKLKALIANFPDFKIITIEQDIAIQYTADFFAYLHKNLPSLDFTFIIGADIAEHLIAWEKFDELIAGTNIAIFSRGGYNIDIATREKLAKYGARIEFIKIPEVTISSTELRSKET